MQRPVVIVTATPNRDRADRISAALVEGELAAAVQIRAVSSRYRWRGTVCDSEEWVLDILTDASRYDDVATCIAVLHPYEMPPIHMVAITGGPTAYLAWISSSGRVPA